MEIELQQAVTDTCGALSWVVRAFERNVDVLFVVPQETPS